MDPDHGHRRPVHGAIDRARHPHLDGRKGIRRHRGAHRRLAHPVPALGDPARSVDLDPAETQRVAGLPAHEGGRQGIQAPAHRSLRAMGECQDRDPGPARRDRGRSRGVVRRPVLCAVLLDPDAQGPAGDLADPDRARPPDRHAVLRPVRMAFRQDRAQADRPRRLPAGGADLLPDLQGDHALCEPRLGGSACQRPGDGRRGSERMLVPAQADRHRDVHNLVRHRQVGAGRALRELRERHGAQGHRGAGQGRRPGDPGEHAELRRRPRPGDHRARLSGRGRSRQDQLSDDGAFAGHPGGLRDAGLRTDRGVAG